jgi:8-oxo-dGTP pyrophosphatase MutT (NUDIX family)
MITVYINEKPIHLTDNIEFTSQNNCFKFIDHNLFDLIEKLNNNDIEDLYLFDEDIKLMFKKFSDNFKIINAAGGIVRNSQKEVLFIFRNGKWDLPKGKVEQKEKFEDAALREVEEECGITDLRIEKFIEKTFHIYPLKNKNILKITYWFWMYSNYKNKFSPQLEEGITRVEWVSEQNLKKVLKNTFMNIKYLCLNLQKRKNNCL